MSDEQINLSASGEARRSVILRDAIAAGRKRRVKRNQRTAIGGTLVLLIAVTVLWKQGVKTLEQMPKQIVKQTNPTTNQMPTIASITKKPVTVTLITTDDRALARYTKPSDRNYVQMIDDRQFLAAMREAGHPVGLAYVNGEAQVLPY